MSNQGINKTGHILQANTHWLGEWFVAKIVKHDTVGARITLLRKERGMTQAELAQQLGVSQPVVSDYEHDVIRIPADVVAQLAQILNTSADEILGLVIEAPRNSTIKNRRLLRQVQAMEKLSKRDQDALLRTIDAFLSKA